MKFATPIDLLLNEIQNVAVQQLASDPGSPVEGQVWENTTTHHFKIYLNGAVYQIDNQLTTLGGDVSVSGTTVTVNTVGGASSTNIADAVTKRHTQNTDTGTTSQTFQLQAGSSGAKLKNISGVIEARNAADSGYADLKVANLIVTGNLSEVSGTQVNLGDQYIDLNNEISVHGSNSDAGVKVKRLDGDDTTDKTVQMIYSESNAEWEASQPKSDGTTITNRRVARVYSVQIGDGAATTFTITHNLNSKAVVVSVSAVASTFDEIVATVQHTSADTITIIFAGLVPTTNQFLVTVIG